MASAQPPPSNPPVAATPEPKEYDGVAAGNVLGIAELLEAIIVDLPMKQLFTSQRVNKQWQATIRQSPRIRRKLWLRAEDEAKCAYKLYGCDDEIHDDVMGAIEPVALRDVPTGARYPLQASLNPFLGLAVSADEELSIPDFYTRGHRDLFDRACCGELIWFKDSTLLALVSDEYQEELDSRLHSDSHASYLDMLLTQPPAKAVMLRCNVGMMKVENEEGVKIGDIVSSCHQMRAAAAEDKFDDSDQKQIEEGGQELIEEGNQELIEEGDEKEDGDPGLLGEDGSDIDVYTHRAGKDVDIKLPGYFFYEELGPAMLLCSPHDEELADFRLKKGVTYEAWGSQG